MPEEVKKPSKPNEVFMKIENLLAGHQNASVIDLKMGITTITLNTVPHRIETCNKKDAATTTKTLGFRITGYIFKDEEGNVTE